MTTIKSTIQCLRNVESGGCESSEYVDIEIEGEFYPAEPDVNAGAQIHDLVAYITDPWDRRHETDLSEDEESDAIWELLAIADEMGLT